MNNAVFGKTIETVRKHRDIKFIATQRKRNYLVSEPNYHTTKFFKENLLAIEILVYLCTGCVTLNFYLIMSRVRHHFPG